MSVVYCRRVGRVEVGEEEDLSTVPWSISKHVECRSKHDFVQLVMISALSSLVRLHSCSVLSRLCYSRCIVHRLHPPIQSTTQVSSALSNVIRTPHRHLLRPLYWVHRSRRD